MKKIIWTVVLIVAIGAYALYYHFDNSPATTASSTSQTSSAPVTTNTGSTSSSGSTPPPTASSTSAGAFVDGMYEGSVAPNIYGPTQVSAVIKNGKLAGINLLQYPNNVPHSTEVSSSSFPVLIQEAISAQSANVHIVSGATQTSQAFQQSLMDALIKAKA